MSSECPNCGFQLTPANRSQAKRLPADWVIPDAWLRWAMLTRPGLNHKEQAEMFKDFWISKSGKDATKLNWEATWRNWVRNAKSFGSTPASATSRSVPSYTRPPRRSDAEVSKSLGTHLPQVMQLLGLKPTEPSKP